MVIRCTSKDLQINEKELLPVEFVTSEFHITPEKKYIVFGVTILSIKNQPVCLVQHISDYGHLVTTPLFLFEILDARVSKHWDMRIHEDGSITFWVPSFYKQYYHDDLFEGVSETVDDFEIVKKKIEEEFVI
ncbi:MAG: hypothetical protein J0M30_02830 [Chitinophagales bacterium]|nr:hypothetical protein [Chitinophagales bacterium]